MSPQFRSVHRPPLLPIPLHQYCLRCLSAWCLFVLDDLWNAVVCFQPLSLFIGKVWVDACDAHLCVSHTLQTAFESGQGTRIVQIDFSAAFDSVNHQGLLYRLCAVGIRGFVLSILTHFLSNRSQNVMVMVVGVKGLTLCKECRRAVFYALGPLLFLLYTSEHFYILQNKLIGHADDSTLWLLCHPQALRLQWQSP